MVDYVALVGFIVAILGAFAHFIEHSHLKKIKCGWLESDCVPKKETPPSTPHLAPLVGASPLVVAQQPKAELTTTEC